jgi:hypothetical protein
VASRPNFFADMVTIPTHRRSPRSRHRAIIDPAGSFCKANAVIPDKVCLDGLLYGFLLLGVPEAIIALGWDVAEKVVEAGI